MRTFKIAPFHCDHHLWSFTNILEKASAGPTWCLIHPHQSVWMRRSNFYLFFFDKDSFAFTKCCSSGCFNRTMKTHEMLVGVKAHPGFSSFSCARWSRLRGMDTRMLADLGLFHGVNERTDYRGKPTHPLSPAAPSALNLFDLLRNAKASGLNGRGTERLAGSWVGIICLTAPDVWTSGGLFLIHESSTVSHQASFFNAACAQNRFLDSDDLLF